MARSAEILVDVCSFAGTGNVLKVQQMLQICAEHAEKPKPSEEEGEGEALDVDAAAAAGAPTDEPMEQDPASSTSAPAGASTEEKEKEAERKSMEMKKQSIATIGIALIAMGEEVGAEMALRQFQHLVSPAHRRVYHLAMLT